MLVLALLVACSPQRPSSADGAPASSSPELKAHMQGHLNNVGEIWGALERGDLDAAQQANTSFLEHKVAFNLPGDWIPRVEAMGEAAVALRASTDIPSAATHAVSLSTACGDCHTAVGVSVELPHGPPAEGHPAARTHLVRLHNALVFPETQAWEGAIADLAAAVPSADADAWAALVEPAQKAAVDARPAAAAAVLASCAGCHKAATASP